jgi:hypothetical protein
MLPNKPRGVARAMALERVRASFPSIRAAHFSAHASFEPFSAELRAVGLPD